MTTKERIYAEIERVGDKDLDELYGLIRDFVASKGKQREPGIMAKLKGIKIDAPEDFAANLDHYASAEQRFEDNNR
jgi:hypothetical protein